MQHIEICQDTMREFGKSVAEQYFEDSSDTLPEVETVEDMDNFWKNAEEHLLEFSKSPGYQGKFSEEVFSELSPVVILELFNNFKDSYFAVLDRHLTVWRNCQ